MIRVLEYFPNKSSKYCINYEKLCYAIMMQRCLMIRY